MPEPGKKRRRIAVRHSPIHGRGVFALKRIPKGTRIIEYQGNLITDKKADRLYSRCTNTRRIRCFLDHGW